MADSNVTANPGLLGAKFAVDDDGVQVWPYAKLAFGAGGTQTEISDADTKRLPVKIGDPLPAGTNVIGHVILDSSGVVHVIIDSAAGALAVTGPLTDTQLRATPVPVSGTVTANAGTNLNTSALALEAGNLATLTAKDFATQATLALIKAKTDNIPADPSREGGVLATAANQTTEIASLGTLDTDLKATQPRDVTDRAARLLGHVTVDTAPTTAVTVASLPLPANAAQETGGNLATLAAVALMQPTPGMFVAEQPMFWSR